MNGNSSYFIQKKTLMVSTIRFCLQTEQIKYLGYPLEVYDVTTQDGYILQLHRIPHGYVNDSKRRKPVVLFIPGMFCTSGVLIINGPNRSLPLLLADLGYDVWIGNQRGTTYSRRHVTYTDTSIFNPQYWNFRCINRIYVELQLFSVIAIRKLVFMICQNLLILYWILLDKKIYIS